MSHGPQAQLFQTSVGSIPDAFPCRVVPENMCTPECFKTATETLEGGGIGVRQARVVEKLTAKLQAHTRQISPALSCSFGFSSDSLTPLPRPYCFCLGSFCGTYILRSSPAYCSSLRLTRADRKPCRGDAPILGAAENPHSEERGSRSGSTAGRTQRTVWCAS